MSLLAWVPLGRTRPGEPLIGPALACLGREDPGCAGTSLGVRGPVWACREKPECAGTSLGVPGRPWVCRDQFECAGMTLGVSLPRLPRLQTLIFLQIYSPNLVALMLILKTYFCTPSKKVESIKCFFLELSSMGRTHTLVSPLLPCTGVAVSRGL